jgi:antigen flippase
MEAVRDREHEGGSYRSILKSTSLIGGASVVNILVGMVRTKFIAILLGPVGVGLLGLYSQVTALVSTLSGMGIATSGVRQVAEAAGTGDGGRLARTVVALRRTAWLTGGLGMLAMIVLAVPISRLTFGDVEHAWPVALLGLTVLLGSISAGQSCVLRGTRRIADVARVTVLGSAIGTALSIPCYYAWGTGGIVVALVLAAVASLGTSWWYARRVPVAAMRIPWRESRDEARALLSLGVSFMGAAVLGAGTNYIIQAMLTRQFGLAGVGIYQAAFGLSGALVGFVLGAMGADYYPRLIAFAGDDAGLRRMVNEQAQVSILLALPGLAAMMVFAPLIIRLFYAHDFGPAVPILRWCVLGILGKVFSWPIGFVLLARGSGRLYLATEAFCGVIQLTAVFLCTRLWGLDGAGIAFMALYAVYTGLMLVVMKATVGGSWTRRTLKLNAAAALVLVVLALNAGLNADALSRWLLDLLVLGIATILCVRRLARGAAIRFRRP